MTFTAEERALLITAASRPEDQAAREVLADVLLEREHPLGELLRLEAEARDLPRRRALEAELREPLRATLVPWARELELDRGLPSWALFSPAMRVLRGEEADATWPVNSVSVAGEFREVVPLLRSRAVRQLHTLDFSAVWATSPFTMWLEGPPPPLEPLPSLVELGLPRGAIPEHWVPILTPGFANVRTLTVSIGPGFELPDWALRLPSVERIRLVPGREPGDGVVVDAALAWAEKRGGQRLEWLEQVMDVQAIRRELRPALPGERPSLPEESHLRVDLVTERPTSRVFRVKDSNRLVMRAEDVPAVDAFAAPRHASLIAPAGLVRIRRALFLELDSAGALLPVTPLPVSVAVSYARQLIEALSVWWGTAAPDVLAGEWVGLGRDQLRVRADGALAIIPTLTRRLGTDAFALPELAGVPFAWSRTAPMIVRFVASVLHEWLSGVSFLESHVGTAMAVHQRLTLRLKHPPRLAGLDASLASFDELLQQALVDPASVSPETFARQLSTTSGPSSPG